MRAVVEPPVVIQAFSFPSVVMQVPLEENEASPDNAGGILRGNRFPGLSVGGANIGKDAVDRIAMSDAAIGRPEGEAVVEGVRKLVGELNFPVRATVFGFVNAEICRCYFRST